MTRNLKALGLVLVAVFAVSAMTASAAVAVTDHFTSDVESTILTGAQKEKLKWTVAGQSIECEEANFKATIKGKLVEEIENIVPSFKVAGCAYGTLTSTVELNGCTYTFSGVTHENAAKELHATAKINCPEGKHINWKLSNGCDLTFKEAAAANGTQTGANGITYTNEEETIEGAKKKDILVKLTVTFKVSHDWTGEGAEPLICKNLVGSLKTTGTITFTGYEDLGGIEGKVVNILVD
jgi:hypothetical protein